MQKDVEVQFILKVGIIAAFATLSFVGTTIMRIPIPATGGYFNLGDTFVMAAALLYGPIVGFFVGLIGPTISDAIGFPQFILATALVKGLEGLCVGLIAYSRKTIVSRIRVIIALLVGIIIIIGGYFVFETYIYPLLARKVPFFGVTDMNAAIAEIVPNAIQGVLSAVVAFGIFSIFSARKKKNV